MSSRTKIRTFTSAPRPWRQRLIFTVLLSVFALLGWRVVDLQLSEHDRLRAEGDARHLRELNVMPARGSILDRNGQVLAVSTPVGSLWAEPALFCAAMQSQDESRWKDMLPLIGIPAKQLQAKCAKHEKSGFQSNFMYIKRRLPPMLAMRVKQLGIPGIGVQQEYKRYYPGGPAGAHLVGFTNVDDVGQEGLESAYQSRLGGERGRIIALKDRGGNYVERVDSLRQVRHGRELAISIDQRIQSMAGDYLESAVRKHHAAGGSVVVLAVPSGEILAMVNSPQFNPNDRSTMTQGAYRNRSVTDVLEPGSTVKPFTVAMALESGKMDADTMIDIAPGTYKVGNHTIHDVHYTHEKLSVADVLVQSSNVGATKIALEFPYQDLFETFTDIGFGQRVANLPGEAAGILKARHRPIEHATQSYGYGLSVTPLQLARAYTVFATDGELLPITLEPKPKGFSAVGKRVFSRSTVYALRAMLERAASPEGTARQARIPRYRVGGKTGTVHKIVDGAYQDDRYQSTFAGIAPLSAPRFVMVVTMDDPRGPLYYGGDIAAPVFANLMKDLLRLYNIKPDALAPNATQNARVVSAAKEGGA